MNIGDCIGDYMVVFQKGRKIKKNISKFMLVLWATPSLVQHGTVGPADYGKNMPAVCHKDVSE